ncbi:MAG TPA: site-2 protease family protein [Candidatus Eremiobacteraceae bacterium]|nr:site-2 protease family protein [Candidatus Eremiobacteraceae bacterium]
MSDPTPDPLAQYQHLLPPGMAQPKSFELQPRPSKTRTGGAVGIGAVLLALLLKFKWLAIGAKFLLPFGSLVLSIWAWALVFGWTFAVGFVLLILVHEMGHFIAARAYGLPVSLPIFIPFLGAAVSIKNLPRDSKASAVVSLAGPLLGGVGALACFAIGMQTGNPFWLALASTMFFINLFNLIPIVPLDGGWVAHALWARTSPMSMQERAAIGAAYVGLAVALLALWQIAGHAVRIAPQ